MANRKREVEEATSDLNFENKRYQVEFDTTEGNIRLDLAPERAPGHCRNLIGLTRIGFYDGVIFHRVIDGFMIQGGCPEGKGTGGPGYQIDAEFNDMPHTAGVLSMARTQDPNSAGSQFFLCLANVAHLDGQYTAFGKTADDESLEVVQKIGRMPTNNQDRPTTEVKINKAEVHEL